MVFEKVLRLFALMLAAQCIAETLRAHPASAHSEWPSRGISGADASLAGFQNLNRDLSREDWSMLAPLPVEFGPGFAYFQPIGWRRVFGAIGSGRFGLEVASVYPTLNFERREFGGYSIDTSGDERAKYFGSDALPSGSMVGGAYYIGGRGSLRALVGFGVGLSRLPPSNAYAFSEQGGAVAYQGFAGIGFALAPNLGLRLSGRYRANSGLEFGDDRSFINSQPGAFGAKIGLVWRR